MSSKSTSHRMKRFWANMSESEKREFIKKRQKKAKEGYTANKHRMGNTRADDGG